MAQGTDATRTWLRMWSHVGSEHILLVSSGMGSGVVVVLVVVVVVVEDVVEVVEVLLVAFEAFTTARR